MNTSDFLKAANAKKAELKSMQKQAYKLLVDELQMQENNEITFEWGGGNAPSIVSTMFDDDITDCYITKLRTDGRDVFADLYAYYIGDDMENVFLADEINVDWIEILEYVA